LTRHIISFFNKHINGGDHLVIYPNRNSFNMEGLFTELVAACRNGIEELEDFPSCGNFGRSSGRINFDLVGWRQRLGIPSPLCMLMRVCRGDCKGD
jgi:hypothetical protein